MSKTEMQKAAAILGRIGGAIGGKSTSEAKVAAARRNGLLGGRPSKEEPAKVWTKEELKAHLKKNGKL